AQRDKREQRQKQDAAATLMPGQIEEGEHLFRSLRVWGFADAHGSNRTRLHHTVSNNVPGPGHDRCSFDKPIITKRLQMQAFSTVRYNRPQALSLDSIRGQSEWVTRHSANVVLMLALLAHLVAASPAAGQEIELGQLKAPQVD